LWGSHNTHLYQPFVPVGKYTYSIQPFKIIAPRDARARQCMAERENAISKFSLYYRNH
jgi:hypothetical protein